VPSSDVGNTDALPLCIVEYIRNMEEASRQFPLEESEMADLHAEYFDTAYEKLLLSTYDASTDASARTAGDKLKTMKERAALASAKNRFVELNEQAGIKAYSSLLLSPEGTQYSESNALSFLVSLSNTLACDPSKLSGSKHLSWAATALASRLNGSVLNSKTPDADANQIADLTKSRDDANTAVAAQIRANRLLGSRVEELERENSELHRILDDNTNKALDSWSTGQIKIGKLEEALSQSEEIRKKTEINLNETLQQLQMNENKIKLLKARLETLFAEENDDLPAEVHYFLSLTFINLCIIGNALITANGIFVFYVAGK
jgi:hypothetical protein